MYSDLDSDDGEAIQKANMKPTAPWIHRGKEVRRPTLTTSMTVKQQLLRQLKSTPRKKAAPKRRRRKSRGLTLSEDEAERVALDLYDSEARSEEDDEPTSGDEAFLVDDGEVESDVSAGDTDEEESASECSESEAEFSDDSEDDEEFEESSEEEDEEVSVHLPMTDREREIMSASVAATQVSRRLTPVLISTDSHLNNIIVSMFWALFNPHQHDVLSMVEALLEAVRLINGNIPLTSVDTSVGACYVWFLSHSKLQANLKKNYDSPELTMWLSAFLNFHTLDDTPVFVYRKKKDQRCFLTGEPCRRGVQLTDVSTRKPIATLWFDASNKELNLWVLNLTRFLFLPATLAQFCATELKDANGVLNEKRTQIVHTWLTSILDEMSSFLYQEHVTQKLAGSLDIEPPRKPRTQKKKN